MTEDTAGVIGRAVAVLVLAFVCLWTVYLARYAILLIYMSALLATGLSPVTRFIHRHSHVPFYRRQLPRVVSIAAVYLTAIGVVAAVVFAIFPPLVNQARQLTQNLPDMVERAQHFLVAHGVESHPLSLQEILQKAPGSTDVVTTILGKFWDVMGGLFGLGVIVVLSFYLLNESESFFHAIISLFPRRRRDEASAVASEIAEKVGAWMSGQLMLCGLIGGSTALGLGLLGLPYFYVLALIAALGEFIPYAGPVAAAVPGIAIGLTMSWQKALVVALFYLVQQQFENHVLVPNLMRHQVGLNAAGVIIAILIGTALLGILGAILAVPTAAILQVLFEELHR